MDPNITDPSDFPGPSKCPGLRDLDASLRCGICQEFYDSPVTLACGHGFCSLCVRNSLAEKLECPQCRKTSSDVQIRPNPSLGETVQAWLTARTYILKLLNETEDLLTRLNAATHEAHTRSSAQTRTTRKRKRSQSNTSSRSSSVELIEDKNLATSSSRSSKPPTQTPPVFDTEEAMPQSSLKSVADCPICLKQVLLSNINAHMDSNCKTLILTKDKPKDRPETISAWKNLLDGDKKGKGKERSNSNEDFESYLPKLAYNTVKDKTIKERLAEYDLPIVGDKTTLASRHRQWVMLFNANVDKSEKQRRSLKDLRRELKSWEAEQKFKKTVVQDTSAHEKRYHHEFKALVAAANSTRVAQARSSSNPPPSSPHTRSTSRSECSEANYVVP